MMQGQTKIKFTCITYFTTDRSAIQVVLKILRIYTSRPDTGSELARSCNPEKQRGKRRI